MPLMSPWPTLTAEDRHTAAMHYERADQLLAASLPDQALGHLRASCEIEPTSLVYRYARRLAQREMGRRPNGRGWVSRAVAAWYLARMKRALRRAAWLDVLRLAERVLDQNVQAEPAHLALALAFDKMGLLDQAIWMLEQADAVCDSRQAIREALGKLYSRRGSFTQAQEVAGPPAELDDKAFNNQQELEREIENRTDNPDSYLRLAKLLSDGGHVLRAREKLAQGLVATRNDFAIALALQELDLDVFRRDLAIAGHRLQVDPENQELQALQSTLGREILSREIDLWRKRSERHPGEASHRLELGIRLLKSGQFEEALESLLAIRADLKCGGRAMLYAAYCHVNRRQPAKAVPLLREALALFAAEDASSKNETLFLLAKFAAEAGNWKEALDFGDQLAGIDPSYKEIGSLLANWRQKAAG